MYDDRHEKNNSATRRLNLSLPKASLVDAVPYRAGLKVQKNE